MIIGNAIDDHSVLKYQRPAEQLQAEGGRPSVHSDGGESDHVIVRAKGAVSGPSTETDGVGENRSSEALGELGDRIKAYSIAASRSHTEVDPSMVLSLFKE